MTVLPARAAATARPRNDGGLSVTVAIPSAVDRASPAPATGPQPHLTTPA
jgi:hypothetical protein